MSQQLEDELGIMPVQQAIDLYFENFPNDKLTKLQIEYEGPFLKYEMVGFNQEERHNYEINAATADEIKNKSKPLKKKRLDKLQHKALNLENLLPLSEINSKALDQVQVDRPFQWELDRKKDRTLWKVEIANERGADIYEVKIDAQDGTILQTKLKSS